MVGAQEKIPTAGEAGITKNQCATLCTLTSHGLIYQPLQRDCIKWDKYMILQL